MMTRIVGMINLLMVALVSRSYLKIMTEVGGYIQTLKMNDHNRKSHSDSCSD